MYAQEVEAVLERTRVIVLLDMLATHALYLSVLASMKQIQLCAPGTEHAFHQILAYASPDTPSQNAVNISVTMCFLAIHQCVLDKGNALHQTLAYVIQDISALAAPLQFATD